MEKWCGLCICPWNRRPKVRDVDGTWQSNNKSDGATKNQPAGKSGGGNVPDGGATGGNQQYVRRINNDAREDEMEENMQAVGGILGNLKSMATDMGAEMEKQNSQLDRINDKGSFVGMRIDSHTNIAALIIYTIKLGILFLYFSSHVSGHALKIS